MTTEELNPMRSDVQKRPEMYVITKETGDEYEVYSVERIRHKLQYICNRNILRQGPERNIFAKMQKSFQLTQDFVSLSEKIVSSQTLHGNPGSGGKISGCNSGH